MAGSSHTENVLPQSRMRSQRRIGRPQPGCSSIQWFNLTLDGRTRDAHTLLAAIPASVADDDARLDVLRAADELNLGSLDAAAHQLDVADAAVARAPAGDRASLEVFLTYVRLTLARQRGDVPGAAERAAEILTRAAAVDAEGHGLGSDLRIEALRSLGGAETQALQIDEAEAHLGQALTLARASARPFLEFEALAALAVTAGFRSAPLAIERATRAIVLAEHHGWTEHPFAALAFWGLAAPLVWQGRLDEAEPVLDRAVLTLRPDVEPAIAFTYHYTRWLDELLRGRDREALRAIVTADGLTLNLRPGLNLRALVRGWLIPLVARLGERERAERLLSELDDRERSDGQLLVGLGWLRLIEGDHAAASRAIAPVLDGSAPVPNPAFDVLHAWLLEALARDAAGESVRATRAVERTLDLAEPDGLIWPFLLHRPTSLLERHRHADTAHAGLVSQLIDRLAAPRASRAVELSRLVEPLTGTELRVLRYLPTNLTAPDIARELYVSTSTVKTHMLHVYDKLGAHRRSEAVEVARRLGLLAPGASP